MTLRQKRLGFQNPWTIEELAEGLKHFYDQHHRYPTATEVDTYPYLPTSRSIERSFGGLVAIRQHLKLDTQADLRSGAHSAERARKINARAHKTEQYVYEFLKEMFGKEFVHREYFFTDDKRTRADFFIYDSQKGFCVDVFYPSDKRNLTGCVNSKLQKYRGEYMREYPVIFLQMNGDISQEILDKIVRNKEKPLHKGQHLMAWGTFEAFCRLREAFKIERKR